jgi:glutamate:GABA antiporter
VLDRVCHRFRHHVVDGGLGRGRRSLIGVDLEVDLATEVYLIMYVLMFVAAANLRRRRPDHPRGYRAPALIMICVVGTVASALACVIGLLPPSQLGHANVPLYAAALLAGVLAVGVLPPVLLVRLRRPTWKMG